LAVLGLITLILIGILIFVPAKKMPKQNPPAVIGIEVTSPKQGEEVSSPIKITGSTDGDGWSGFEGQVGTVHLLDYKGNKIAEGILKATTDWTKPPVSFEADLIFQTKTIGPMSLLFSNENPSGDPEKDKTFILPIKVK